MPFLPSFLIFRCTAQLVLRPVLFLVFINDLLNLLTSSIRLFADDGILYWPICSPSNQVALQQDLNSVYAWCSFWLLPLNASKYRHFQLSQYRLTLTHQYYIGPSLISFSTSYKYLGLTLSTILRWSCHTHAVVNDVSVVSVSPVFPLLNSKIVTDLCLMSCTSGIDLAQTWACIQHLGRSSFYSCLSSWICSVPCH